MSSSPEYIPPKVWTWSKPSGGLFANINRPVAGSTHEKELPVGRHPFQLYSLPLRTARRSRSCSRSCWLWAMAPSMTPG